MKAGFCTVNGRWIRYLHAGQGKPLLLLHGIGHSADLFIRNIDALGKDFAVYAVDLPGHGFSEALPPGKGAPHAEIVETLAAFMQALGLGSYAILGSSFGGLLACLTALSYPEQVQRLIVVSSGGAFHDAAEQRRVLEGVLQNAGGVMQTPTSESCRKRLGKICFDPGSVAEEILLTQLTAYAIWDRHAAFTDIIGRYHDSLEPDNARVLHRLSAITQPALIITGREDIRASVSAHEQAQREIPNAVLHVFERCGHFPYMEHPTSSRWRACMAATVIGGSQHCRIMRVGTLTRSVLLAFGAARDLRFHNGSPNAHGFG